MKYTVSKIILLLIYAIAGAGLLGLVSQSMGSTALNISAVLVGIHILELIFVYKYVKRYTGPGGLAASIALTLLFGLLHWRPLAQTPSATATKDAP